MRLIPYTLSLLALFHASTSTTPIDRKLIIRTFNLHLNSSHSTSPVHLGNGNFGFGTDITGLQTFLPHNTLSSWGWHNSSLPTTTNQSSIEDYEGLKWWTHGRLIEYAQPNPAKSDISQWLIRNPHRINLGRIGLSFGARNVSESDLKNKRQELDLWTGLSKSTFLFDGEDVTVSTVVDPETDTVGVEIESPLLGTGNLGVFFDFPYASGKNKFDAPFVGLFNETGSHSTNSKERNGGAQIRHTLDATSYVVDIGFEGQKGEVRRENNSTHKYILTPGVGATKLAFTATFSPHPVNKTSTFDSVKQAAESWWQSYWTTGAFISLPLNHSSAHELQRRIILSQYLLATNYAGTDPPQESGLVNNGWYGKFHMEMIFWHMAHWQHWGKWDIYNRCVPGVYERFLLTSIERAKSQGYKGARIGKMSDPSGRSAPGEINSLLIWQQPHPMYFAEMEWRRFPSNETLKKWDGILGPVAEFMASYAWWNESTKVYDLGPPMYPVSENTNPNVTINPAFELAYWRFGLDVAMKWQVRQGKGVPESWKHVYENLAPFPVENGVYVTYEGIPNMWNTSTLSEDHPGLLGLYGWLPPDPRLNIPTLRATVDQVYRSWNFSYSYGWDFPVLAMAAARLGDADGAVKWLLDENYQFDEVGMPVGGTRVPTPYFPASSGLLLAVAMMAGGWDGARNMVWPEDWDVRAEGFERAM